ncbi:hypothetical protein EDD21DRAFT_353296 [Dissophora ornata]|nr:hypothetical protein EDD21DRAFT_353296 [Dissophora ornata]
MTSDWPLSKQLLPLFQRTRRRRQHPIFSIVEVLQNVFSFLNQRTLRYTVRLVCTTWCAASERHLACTTTWLDLCDQEQRASALERLACGRTTILKIVSNERQYAALYSIASARLRLEINRMDLHELIAALEQKSKERFQEIVMSNVNRLERELLPLLSHLTLVTSIRLENLFPGQLCIHTVLAGCPTLRRLEIESVLAHTFEPGKIVLDEGAPALPTQLKLQSLVISGMILDQPALDSVLASSPNLKELRLVGIIFGRYDAAVGHLITPSSFDRQSFLQQMSTRCPRIQSIHFSHATLTIPSHQDLKLQLDLFPALRSLSLASKDATMHTLRYAQSFYQNNLTSLELIDLGPGRGETWSFLSDCLHEFLCSSPQLLHLKAPRIKYFTEYLNVLRQEDHNCPHDSRGEGGEGEKHASGCTRRHKFKPDLPPLPIWVCRNLQTLHLQFQGRGGDYFSPFADRIMFAYIAKVCPKIRDLQIRRECLNLNLTGGWFLLSRLKDLERLRIETGFLTELKANDLMWMEKKEPSPWLKKPRVVAQGIRSKIRAADIEAGVIGMVGRPGRASSNNWTSNIEATVDGLESTVKDIEMAISLQTVTDMQSEKGSAHICWPDLERFELAYDQTRDVIPAFIAGVLKTSRPEWKLWIGQKTFG